MWLSYYSATTDKKSPFYQRVYSEFEFTNSIYNYLIHPQWDEFGSATLYLKILQADYKYHYAIIEFIGEWNDCLYNDIMFLKENVIDILVKEGINKFILIGENVFNFHYADDSYYQEWFDEIPEGWISCVNFRKHVVSEFNKAHLHYYLNFDPRFVNLNWRCLNPLQLFKMIDSLQRKKIKS